MTEEKQYHEEVTTASSLTNHQTSSSHGLHHDHIAAEALGGHTADLGRSYYTSINFIGTVIVSSICQRLIRVLTKLQATCLAQISGYLGWVLPANTLLLINEAIGPSPDIIWVGISWTAGFAIGFTLVGRLSDIFGRRWFFIASSVLGLLGNIIGASAQSINMLIVCPQLQTLSLC